MSGGLPDRKQRKTITRELIVVFLTLLKQGRKRSDIAKILDVSEVTVKRLIRRYNEGELDDPTLFESAPEKKRRKRSSHSQEEEILRERIAERCTITQDEMVECLSEEGFPVSQPTVSRMLESAGYSWKKLIRVPSSRNLDRCIETRKEYAQVISEIPDEMLIFLDETGFNLHTCPSRGYSLFGTEARMIVPMNRGRNVSLMCAISISGVLTFELIIGPYNSQKFCDFIKDKLVPAITSNNLNNVRVVMDNCRIHKTDSVRNILDEHQVIGMYLPPYSPQLNPIEETFSVVKNRFKRLKNRPKNVNEIIAAVSGILAVPINTIPMYLHTREFVEKAKKGEEF